MGGGSGTKTLWRNLIERFLGVTKVSVDAARKALPRYQLTRNPIGAGGAWGGQKRNTKKVTEKNHTWQMDLTEFGMDKDHIHNNRQNYIGWNTVVDVCSRFCWTLGDGDQGRGRGQAA